MSSLSPIILFVYNRPEETKKTLDTLQVNLLAEETDLYIFSDAAKEPSQQENVKDVRSIIHSVDGFKSVSIIEQEKNKGLAPSIIDGVSSVLLKHKKAIVLEDDLVTSPNFLSYMNQSLDFYEKDKQIASISGCTYHINIPQNYLYDVYFTRRMCSHGWAIWLDRWESIDWELKDYDSFKNNWRENLKLMKGGEDLPRMLAAYKKGKINSWAVRFCYHQYKTNTFTVWPTQSKVDNKGFNVRGSNTKRMKALDRIDFASSDKTVFRFPENVFINKTINRRFLRKFKIITRIITNFILK